LGVSSDAHIFTIPNASAPCPHATSPAAATYTLYTPRRHKTPPHKPPQPGYIPNDSVRKPSISRLQVAAASVSLPFPISFGRTMYLVMASAHESAPGTGRRLHRESTVLHYSHHGQNYEKRALMHHSSSLCSFSRDRSESRAHRIGIKPFVLRVVRCSIPIRPCLALLHICPVSQKLRRSHA